MADTSRANRELIEELSILKQNIKELERSQAERYRSEEMLQKSEQSYRLLFESNPQPGWVYDLETVNFLAVNDGDIRKYGYSREEFLGMSIADIRPHVDVSVLPENTGGLHEANSWRHRIKDGTIIDVEIMSHTLTFKGRKARLVLVNDISDRKRTEEAVALAKNDWDNTFDAVTDSVTIHDEDFNIIRANLAARAMLALPLQEETRLAKCFKIYHGTERPPGDCPSCPCLQTGRPSIVEIFEPYLNKHLKIKAMPRIGSDGHPAGIIHVVRDITHRKKTEEQLQHNLDSLRKAVRATIQAMVSAVEARDPYTAGHQLRSANLARAISTEMGLPKEKIDGIRMACTIHDIGKLAIPAEILSNPMKLSEMEFSLIKEHSRRGYEMLRDVESPWPLAEIVYQHHERMDGSGYPRNLQGEEILIEAKVLAVADVVEAMASHRPYRPAIGIDAALQEIEKHSNVVYDSAVADACLRLFRGNGYIIEGFDYNR